MLKLLAGSTAQDMKTARYSELFAEVRATAASLAKLLATRTAQSLLNAFHVNVFQTSVRFDEHPSRDSISALRDRFFYIGCGLLFRK